MMGAGDRVVGVSSWCRRPREALTRPKVASYTEVLPERVAELEPDLVLTTTGVQKDALSKLQSLGCPVYPVPIPRDVYGILSNIVDVGGLVGENASALELAGNLSTYLMELKRLRPGNSSLTAYVEIDLGGPTIPAYYSHVTSALHLAGIANVYVSTPESYLYGMKVADYPVLDVVKELEHLNPDVIVYESKSLHPDMDEGYIVMVERGLKHLKAVENGRVITVPADTLAHYGPSFLKDVKEICVKIWSLMIG